MLSVLSGYARRVSTDAESNWPCHQWREPDHQARAAPRRTVSAAGQCACLQEADESKGIPTLAPVLDAVEMDLKLIGHLLQRQTLCQSEHPLRPHPRTCMRVIDPYLMQRPSLFAAKIQSQLYLCLPAIVPICI
jgi:hypothetical protein